MSETTKTPGEIIRNWWGRSLGLDEHFDNGAARKARAQLCRASIPSEVLSLAVTHELHHGLNKVGAGWRFAGDDGPERLALIAAVIAGLEKDARRSLRALEEDGSPESLKLVAAVIAGLDRNARGSLPRRFGEKQDDRPRLSHLRFQRILRAGEAWELAVRLRRALPLVGRKAYVAGLGVDLLDWNEDTRNRWCFHYFGASAPGEDNTEDTAAPQADHLAATEQG